jgi:hypothetical protein
LNPGSRAGSKSQESPRGGLADPYSGRFSRTLHMAMTMNRTMNSEGPRTNSQFGKLKLSSHCSKRKREIRESTSSELWRCNRWSVIRLTRSGIGNGTSLFHYRAEWDSRYSSLDCSRGGVSTGMMKLQGQENMYSSFPDLSLGKLTREGESRSCHRMIARHACAHATPGLSPREIASLLTIRVLVSRKVAGSSSLRYRLHARKTCRKSYWLCGNTRPIAGPSPHFGGQFDRGPVESEKGEGTQLTSL